MLLLLFSDVSLRSQPASKEYQLKAAFLFNFTKFVEWNAESTGAPDSPIIIAVLGSPAFSDEVENAVRNRKVNGRPLSVKNARNAAEARTAHLLFISAEEDARVAGILAGLRGSPVLTVGESRAFAKSGGTITFEIENGKVRFDINMSAAEQASIRISAQLQKLARSVQR